MFVTLVVSSLVSCSTWRGMKRDLKNLSFRTSRVEYRSLETEKNLERLAGKVNTFESAIESRVSRAERIANEAQQNATKARQVTDELQKYSGGISVTPLFRNN